MCLYKCLFLQLEWVIFIFYFGIVWLMFNVVICLLLEERNDFGVCSDFLFIFHERESKSRNFLLRLFGSNFKCSVSFHQKRLLIHLFEKSKYSLEIMLI